MAESSSTQTQSQNTALTPEGHEPFDLPDAPDLPACPVCKIGLLYVIAHDPDALHEQDQKFGQNDPTAHDNYVASGGAIILKCFNCGMPQSQALNPGNEE